MMTKKQAAGWFARLQIGWFAIDCKIAKSLVDYVQKQGMVLLTEVDAQNQRQLFRIEKPSSASFYSTAKIFQ